MEEMDGWEYYCTVLSLLCVRMYLYHSHMQSSLARSSPGGFTIPMFPQYYFCGGPNSLQPCTVAASESLEKEF